MRALLRTAAVLLLGAALVVGAIRLPDLRYRPAGSSAAEPADSAQGRAAPVTSAALICPGPPSVGVKGIDGHTATSPAVVRVAAAPSDLLLSATPAVPVSGPGSVSAGVLGGSGHLGFAALTSPGAGLTQTSVARSILLSGKGSLAPGLVGSQTTTMLTGDQRGLSTQACGAPSAQTWLVGGGGDPGRRGRIVLTNPAPNAVTVDLEVYGAAGPVAAPTGRGIVVPAHGRTVVLLDAIAPGERSPVIHVVATGGVVGVSMSETWLLGTTAVGADSIVGTAEGTRLVVPGISAAGTPGSTVLRVAATGSEAVVQLKLLGVSGPIAAPVVGGVVRVAAHTVKDVDLSAIPAGVYGLQLSSDAPIVAGVQLRPGVDASPVRRDLAWTAAEPALAGLSGLPLGPTLAPWDADLALSAATADASLDLVLVDVDGTETTRPVTVAAGTTLAVPLRVPGPALASIWLRPHTGAVSAALVTSYADPAGPLISVAPLTSAALLTTPVSVHPLAN